MTCCDTDNINISLIPTRAGDLPASFSAFGYSSPEALAAALQVFAEAHSWSLRSLAKAYVLCEGGIEWSQKPQKMPSLLLATAATVGVREHNPARTFRFSSFRFSLVDDEFPSHSTSSQEADRWARWDPLRKKTIDTWSWHPEFAGLLPVVFVIDGLNVGWVQYHPQFRPAHPSSPNPLLVDEEAKMAVLKDIITLSGSSINAGIPLRPAEGSSPEGIMLALPGRFVRGRSASWIWTPLFPSWADYRRGVHRDLDDMFDTHKLRSNTLAESMVAFNLL